MHQPQSRLRQQIQGRSFPAKRLPSVLRFGGEIGRTKLSAGRGVSRIARWPCIEREEIPRLLHGWGQTKRKEYVTGIVGN